MHKVKRISSIVLYTLLGISALTFLGLLFFFNDSPGPERQHFGLDVILIWSAILLLLAIVTTLVMAALNVAKNPTGSRTALIGIAVLAVVLVVTYLLSSAEPITLPDRTVVSDGLTLTWADMGLYTTYVALIGAALAVVVGEVRNSFK